MKNRTRNWLSHLTAMLTTVVTCVGFAGSSMGQMAVAAHTGHLADVSMMEDTVFISKSIQDVMKEMRMTRMAVDKAASQPVKNLAEQMVKDQKQMLFELKRAARSFDMAGMDSDKSDADLAVTGLAPELAKELEGADGTTFDAMWVSHMFSVYDARLNELTTVSRYDESPEIRTIVRKAIPIVRRNRDVLSRMNRQVTISDYSSRD
jgi:predicted outer membrane protein